MKPICVWGSLLFVVAAVVLACSPYPGVEEAADSAEHDTNKSITLSPLTGSPGYEQAELSLNHFDVDGGGFDFSVQGYELGIQTADAGTNGLANSAKGQHIHLIVDNGPYSAHYENQAQVDLEPGVHTVMAFLSRSYHESVKAPSAAVLTEVTVGSEGDQATDDEGSFDAAAPHLFYSRPKGTYVGADTKKLMLDFYLANITLSADGYRVIANVEGQEFVLDTWQPYVIEGLKLGEVTVDLRLVDAGGEMVPGPYNQVSRTVTLEAAAE